MPFVAMRESASEVLPWSWNHEQKGERKRRCDLQHGRGYKSTKVSAISVESQTGSYISDFSRIMLEGY